ncbi:MAG: hypothetical protein WCW77_02020, partial [Patescibacteria group bacterium]
MASSWSKSRVKKPYYRKASGNPFFNRPKKRNSLSAKAKIISFLVLFLMAGLIWILFFSKLFLINSLEIQGQPEEIKKAIEEKAWQETKKRRFLFFTEANLFIFDKNRLADSLKTDYAFDQLMINKSLFHKIKIEFHQKDFSLVWKEGDKYYFIDDKGVILKEADPLNIKTDNFPIIENQGEPLAENKKIGDELSRLDYTRNLFAAIKSNKDQEIKIEKFVIDKDAQTVKLLVNSGPQILFSIEAGMDGQLTRLFSLIKEKLKDEYLKK